LGCKVNDALVKDVVCRYKGNRSNLGQFRFAGTPVVPLTGLWLKLDSFHKNSANHWQLGRIHLKQDVCRFYKDKNNLIFYILGAFKEGVFDKLIKECPYPSVSLMQKQVDPPQLKLFTLFRHNR
jgi:hypothetical protein